ncbi:glycerophosphodiester phosphodiesterase GDPD1, chloroplastic-like [Henckelia pumila]|uniref:glycerophosphodiester phosphodiesterase GDPD1, chloroplastic-like n=1 Tax=Henckelia pumila TaxID=405737 RepID=UPI003C6DEFAB
MIALVYMRLFLLESLENNDICSKVSTETDCLLQKSPAKQFKRFKNLPLLDDTICLLRTRGNGMNMLQSTDLRFCAFKENTILSFNTTANFPIDYIELDVQVTKDGCPVIFHDNFLFSEDNFR